MPSGPSDPIGDRPQGFEEDRGGPISRQNRGTNPGGELNRDPPTSRSNPERRGSQFEGANSDNPPAPRDYNLDLPGPEDDEPRDMKAELHQITEQNERIIDLLRQIKNSMR